MWSQDKDQDHDDVYIRIERCDVEANAPQVALVSGADEVFESIDGEELVKFPPLYCRSPLAVLQITSLDPVFR